MPVDLDGLAIVDSHCHPFMPELESSDFTSCWTLSTAPMPEEDLRSTVLFQMMATRMARFLGLADDASWSEVAAQRSARYRADPGAYIDALFAHAGITTLLIDIGYPSHEDEGVEIEPSAFRSLLPNQDVRLMIRIEPVMYDLLTRGLPFREFVPAFRATLQEQATELHAVALKSTIAYYTGLEVQRVRDADAERAYSAVLKAREVGGRDRAAEKLYRDYLLLEATEVAISERLPLQIHTGMGNAPGILLRESDPANLQWLLSDDHYAAASIVLVHAGYPNHAGAAFLAATHPNVWLDVSEMVPFVGAGIPARLRELFDTIPLRKVMYGSDGFNIPELFWLAALEFKEALAGVMDGLVADGRLSSSFAAEASAGILAENARRLYRL